MLKGLHPEDERFLANLSRINERAVRAQRQVSSGKRIETVSDNPDEVSNLLAARADLARIRQVNSNLGRIKTEVDMAEESVANSIKVVERARVLAAQGFNGTQTAETRAGIAAEVRNLMQQLVNQSNAFVNGRYLFAGNADATQPFTFSEGPPLSAGVYQGSAATRAALNATGNAFPIALSGAEIFASPNPSQNAFAAISDLYAALTSNDEAAIGIQVARLATAGEYLNQKLAFYGAAQNNVRDAVAAASNLEVRLQGQISQTEDADLSEAIVAMNRAAFEQQATLQSRGRLPQQSLFDYLG